MSKNLPAKKTNKQRIGRKGVSNKRVQNSSIRMMIWLFLAVVIIVTYITFSPVMKNNFTNWDDGGYVITNKMLAKPASESIAYFFTHSSNLNYHPLTMIVLSIEYHFAKLNPELYHTTSLLIHLLNVLMVFWFIYLLSEKKPEVAAIVTILFAIHPMHVESVAWLSELKDVLYTFFYIGGLISYYKYRFSSDKKSIGIYFLTLILFILSCLSKPSAVTFSLILVGIDFCTNRKFNKQVWLEKIPFFITSIIFGIVTLKVQVPIAVAKFETFTIFQRIMHGCYGMLDYLFKLVFPVNLSALYPYPTMSDGHLPYIFYISPFIAILLFFLVYKSLNFNRLIGFGFLFFFFNIVLVLQFMPVGSSLISERYSYVSYIGLFFIIAMYFSKLYRSKNEKFSPYKSIAIVAFFIISISFAYQSNARCKVWQNCNTLWTDVINKYPDNAEAHTLRGTYLVDKSKYDIVPSPNDFDKAFEDFNNSIRIKNNDPMVYSKRGNIFGLRGNYDKALSDYSYALKLDSTDEEIYLNRAITYCIMKNYDKAFLDFDKYLKMGGDSIMVYKNRSLALMNAGKFKESIVDYTNLIKENRLDPNFYFFRGINYFNLENYEVAIADNSKAIELNPNYKEAYNNRSQCYLKLNKIKNALDDALKAQGLGYPEEEGYINKLKSSL